MNPLVTKISAFGLLSFAVSFAAMRGEEPSGRDDGKPAPGEATSRSIRSDEAPLPRGPTKARGRVTDQSHATRMKARGRVIVGGQVHISGPVRLSRGMTLEAAISKAGGATPFGSLKRVGLVRGSRSEQFDLTHDSARAIVLSDNDTIIVPQKMMMGR